MSSIDSVSSSRAATESSTLPVFLIAFLTLVGGLVRFWALGGRDFWFDESCTYLYVHYLFDWPFGSSFFVESTNTPYYFLLRAWSTIFGETEAGYRSFSALCATLTIPVVGAIAWRLRGALAGIFAAILVAVHPLHIYYSREARAYALWCLLLSCSLYSLVEATKTGRRRWWVAFGFVTLLSLPTHYFSVYFLAGSSACVFLSADWRKTGVRWAVTAGVVALGFVPWLLVAVLPAASLGGAKWVAPGFDALTAIPHSLWAMLPCGAYPGHLRGLSVASAETAFQSSWLVVLSRVVPALLLIVIGAVLMLRKSVAKNGAGRRNTVFLLGVSVGPLLLAWLYAVVVSPNYLVGRYDLVAWPGVVVLIAIVLNDLALATRKGFTLSLIAGAVLVGCSAVPLVRMQAAPSGKSLYRLRAEGIAALAGSDDLVITFSYDRDAMLYYLHRAGCDATLRSYPGWLDTQIGWIDSEADLAGDREGAAVRDAKDLAVMVSGRISDGDLVFLVTDSSDPEGQGPRSLLGSNLITSLREAGLVTVEADREMLIYEIRRGG